MKTRKGHRLFNNNPRGKPRTRGIGYGSAEKARKSILLLRDKPPTYQRQVATTMFFRAKHHKYQNEGMRAAMKVWGEYIAKINQKYIKQ